MNSGGKKEEEIEKEPRLIVGMNAEGQNSFLRGPPPGENVIKIDSLITISRWMGGAGCV